MNREPIFKYGELDDFQKALYLEHQVKGLLVAVKSLSAELKAVKADKGVDLPESARIKILRKELSKLQNALSKAKGKTARARRAIDSHIELQNYISREISRYLGESTPQDNTGAIGRLIFDIQKAISERR